MTVTDFKSEIVRLNVGGTLYEVSSETLEHCKGTALASLVSNHGKEAPSDEEAFFIDPDDETVFIDRNGRLFEYVLDFLRTGKIHLPPSVSRSALQEEFDYYGIVVEMNTKGEEYDCDYFLQVANEVTAKSNRIAAMNAAKKSAQIMEAKQSSKREIVFFIMIEYYKINPSAGSVLTIEIPLEYRRDCRSPWVFEDLRKHGFEVMSSSPSSNSFFLKIQREPTDEENPPAKVSMERSFKDGENKKV